ncbi:MAG: cation:proton antiporter [Acidobacteriia bacterium]|nr:cation:proton antiporter [Terriglobia bacterium]MYG04615.1 cation:proton antiporter [Terriglobia bacterium]MYK08716.1 cation:proton antiporter [Terriglobia bacterium]
MVRGRGRLFHGDALRFPKSYPLRLICLALIGTVIWLASEPEGVSEHGGDVTPFLLAFAVILLAARAGGEIFERLNQPAVLGELVFGILLGNLGLLGLEVEALRDTPFLAVAAEIRVILLLFQVGLECDLDNLLAVGPSAVTVAVIGVAAPLALGFAVSSVFMPEDVAWYAHLFVGATLAATSVGITARVLKDLELIEKAESKLVLGAAVVDDILGLVILAFMLGLVHSADQGTSAGLSLMPLILIGVKAVGFLAGSILMSRTIIMPIISLVEHFKSKSGGMVLSVACCFVMAALADLIGLADIVGAFAAGLVIDRAITKYFGGKEPLHRIEKSVTPLCAVFVPVFFVYMGMRVELSLFAFPAVLVFAALLSVTAVVSKLVCSLGVLDKSLNRIAVGVSMIPRGEVGLIFAGVGSSAMVSGKPLFSAETFSAMVAMVMLTTLLTPPLIARAFGRGGPGVSPSQAAQA